MWTAGRILKQLAPPDLRREILAALFRWEEPEVRQAAAADLAKALRFREQSVRKMPVGKKVGLLAMRLGDPTLEPYFERSLVQYLTHTQPAMLGAFLDAWGIPHQDGTIEADDVEPPSENQVREATETLGDRFPAEVVDVYLAACGVTMGEGWARSTWPVVAERVASRGSEAG